MTLTSSWIAASTYCGAVPGGDDIADMVETDAQRFRSLVLDLVSQSHYRW